MIGLVDLDLQQSTSSTLLIPNIEIMKLATYYRIEENQFCRLVDLNETELTSYDKIYFFSEQEQTPEVPEAFRRANNVIFGGTAFTNGIYQPFDNEIIDYTIPRPMIYKEFLKDKYKEGIKAKVINHVLDDTYYRNYAGENKLPLPAILPKKRVILYDKDFFYPDWEQTIKTISDRKCSGIYRVHPIICKTVSQFLTVRSYEKINRSNEIILNFGIPLEEVSHLLAKYKNYFLAEIVPSSNVFFQIGGTAPTKLKYSNDIGYILQLLYCFWAAKIPVKLKYEPPNLGTSNPFEDLLKLIATWSQRLPNKTINERIPKNKKFNYLREQRDEIIRINPYNKDLFDQSYKKLIESGRWNIWR